MAEASNCYFVFKWIIIFVGGKTFEKEDGGVVTLTLGDLLAFVTGAEHPPPLGFLYSPEIEFSDDAERTLPWASTCTMVLHLSLHVNQYDLLSSNGRSHNLSKQLWTSVTLCDPLFDKTLSLKIHNS